MPVFYSLPALGLSVTHLLQAASASEQQNPDPAAVARWRSTTESLGAPGAPLPDAVAVAELEQVLTHTNLAQLIAVLAKPGLQSVTGLYEKLLQEMQDMRKQVGCGSTDPSRHCLWFWVGIDFGRTHHPSPG